MEQSILKSTKKILNVGDDDTTFDLDIMTHINAAFSNLHDLGVGPQAGFVIDDDSAEWADFLGGVEDTVVLSKVKNYVYLKTRQLFDPPATQYLVDALAKQITELEWRINVNREESGWTDPEPVVVLDGGDPSD